LNSIEIDTNALCTITENEILIEKAFIEPYDITHTINFDVNINCGTSPSDKVVLIEVLAPGNRIAEHIVYEKQSFIVPSCIDCTETQLLITYKDTGAQECIDAGKFFRIKQNKI
jgi:hypothetical protein